MAESTIFSFKYVYLSSVFSVFWLFLDLRENKKNYNLEKF